MTSPTPHGHIVIAGVEPWGHARPTCAFASRISLARPVYITLFTTPRVYDRVKTEISQSFGPLDAGRLAFMRVIALDASCPPSGNRAEDARVERERYHTSFASAYEKLVNETTVICAATKIEFAAVPAPKIVIADLIAGETIATVRKIPQNRAKIFCFCAGMATFAHLAFAPLERGGRGDFRAQAEEEAKRTGKHLVQAADDLFHDFTDTVVQPPGLPPMYHWECDPQDCSPITRGAIAHLWLSMRDNFTSCDGVILASPEVYEPKAVAAMREWFSETGRPVWAVGPLLSLTASTLAITGEDTLSTSTAQITKFMDNNLKSHGEHSMLYISFGTIFWPPQPDKLEAFLDVVIERRIPFILSYGSPIAQISKSFRTKVEGSGIGLLSPWSPQQIILDHPALGWFVSHCGHSSVMESISFGVPLICWPYHGDQITNTTNLCLNHDVAYELVEVRTGNGLKRQLHTGKAPVGTVDALQSEAHIVLGKAFSADGARKRANVQRLRENISAAWGKDGSSEREVRRLLELLMPLCPNHRFSYPHPVV